MKRHRLVVLDFGVEATPSTNEHGDPVRVDTSGAQWALFQGSLRAPRAGALESLKWVISERKRREWVKEVSSLFAAPSYSATIKDTQALIRRIQNADPTSLLSLSERDLAVLRSELPAGITENLQALAKAIVSTPNVFAFPQFVAEKSYKNKETLHGFISQLGDDICDYLRVDPNPQNFCLAFFETKKCEGIDLKGTLIARLVAGVSRVLEENVTLMDRPGPVLFEGRTGSGKSHAAAIYAKSRDKKFFKVNVSAVQESFVETRLRGYQKGYHSMANDASPGWFEFARDGVLLLDEFQSAPHHVQVQLLDIIDATSNRVRVARMGEEGSEQFFDVKLVIAVNKPISELLASGEFREDLYFRMRSVVCFPDLNTLLSDLAARRSSSKTPRQYVRELLSIMRWKFAPVLLVGTSHVESWNPFLAFENEAIDLLVSRDWPGNYREFETVAADLFWSIDRVGVASTVKTSDIQSALANRPSSHLRQNLTQNDAAVVAALVEKALIENSFVLTKACRDLAHLKIKDYATLRHRIVQYFDLFSPQTQMNAKIKKIFDESKAKKRP